MKKTLYLIILIAAFYGSYYFYTKPNSADTKIESTAETTTENIQTSNNEITYYKNLNDGIFIAKFPNEYSLELIDLSKRDTLPQVTEIFEFSKSKVLINAGYFLEDYSHAGLLIDSEGNNLGNLAYNDSQLTHIVKINQKPEILTHDKYLELANEATLNSTYFQTGPLIIENNSIKNDLIQSSINGNGGYRRSLLGIMDNGEFFFVATSKSYNLIDLADYILDLEIFKDKNITVVNLDGGSSVAIDSRDNDDFSLGSTKKLPYLLGALKKE